MPIDLISITGNAEMGVSTFVKEMFGVKSVTQLSQGSFSKTFCAELQDGTKAVVKEIRSWNGGAQRDGVVLYQPLDVINDMGGNFSSMCESVLHEVRMHQIMHNEGFNIWPVVPVVLEINDSIQPEHHTYFTLQKMVVGTTEQETISSVSDFMKNEEIGIDRKLSCALSVFNVIESMLERGFIQNDFHFGNFLVSNLSGNNNKVKIYPIDFGICYTHDDNCIARNQDGVPCRSFFISFVAGLNLLAIDLCNACSDYINSTLINLSGDELKLAVEQLMVTFEIDPHDIVITEHEGIRYNTPVLGSEIAWKLSSKIITNQFNQNTPYLDIFREFKRQANEMIDFFCHKIGIEFKSLEELKTPIGHIPDDNEINRVGKRLSTISQEYETTSFYSKFVKVAQKYSIDGHVENTKFEYTNKYGFKVKIIKEKVLRGYVKKVYDDESLIGEKRKANSGRTIFGKTYSQDNKIIVLSSLIKKYFVFGTNAQSRQPLIDKINKLWLISTKQKVLDLYKQIQRETNGNYDFEGVYTSRKQSTFVCNNWERQKLIVKYWNKTNPNDKITISDILKIQKDLMPWYAQAKQFDESVLKYFESKLVKNATLCDDDPRSFEYENTNHEHIKITMLPHGRYSKTYLDSTIDGMIDEDTIKSATIFFHKDGRIDDKLTSEKMLQLAKDKIRLKILKEEISKVEDLANTAWTQRRRQRFAEEAASKTQILNELNQRVEGQKVRRRVTSI